MDLDLDSEQSWCQNHSKIRPILIAVSTLVSKSTFASRTRNRSFREGYNPLKHIAFCSKIDFAHFRTSGQVSSSLGSNFDQNLSMFDRVSLPNSHLQQTLSFGAVCASKVFKTELHKDRKMCHQLWDHLVNIKLG